MTDQSFAYSQVSKETASEVQHLAMQIRAQAQITLHTVVLMGVNLTRIKEVLGHGCFGDWLQCEFGWATATAENYMNVARVFGDKIPTVGNLERINLAGLYILATRRVNSDVQADAIKLLIGGENLTVAASEALRDAPALLRARYVNREITQAAFVGLHSAAQAAVSPAVKKLALERITDPEVVPMLDALPEDEIQVIALTGYLQGTHVIPVEKLTIRDVQAAESNRLFEERRAMIEAKLDSFTTTVPIVDIDPLKCTVTFQLRASDIVRLGIGKRYQVTVEWKKEQA